MRPALCSKLHPCKDRTGSCRIFAQASEIEVVNPASEEASTSVAASAQAQAGESVTVEEEVLPNSHIRLTVTVPVAFVRKAYLRAMKKLRVETDVPGFRKGKKVWFMHLCISCGCSCGSICGPEAAPIQHASLMVQVPDRVVINAAGGPEAANGACMEIILNDVLPVVRLLQLTKPFDVFQSSRRGTNCPGLFICML